MAEVILKWRLTTGELTMDKLDLFLIACVTIIISLITAGMSCFIGFALELPALYIAALYVTYFSVFFMFVCVGHIWILFPKFLKNEIN